MHGGRYRKDLSDEERTDNQGYFLLSHALD